MKYPLVSIKSGDDEMTGIWVSIGFSSKERDADVLHLVGGDPVSPQHARMGWLPIYLERYDQALSCYQGADKIVVKDDSINITLNNTGRSALHLPKTLEFVSAKPDDDFKQARDIFAKMKTYESGKIIQLV